MVRLNMQGSYTLDSETINEIITKTSAGNYALGHTEDKTFYVQYVGRSDTDLKARLLTHASDKKYAEFKYSYATSPKAAFEKECQNFHDFGGISKLSNTIHPDRPSNSKDWECPVCTIFDK